MLTKFLRLLAVSLFLVLGTVLFSGLAAGAAPDHHEKKVRKVVFVAGRDSHGYGAHEHEGGCRILKQALDESGLPIATSIHTGGWPKDAKAFEGADTVVIYCDGGGNAHMAPGRGHVINHHLDQFEQLAQMGVGLVCLHYGVEVEKGTRADGKAGDSFLRWTGGYFERHWSVNPHWTAKFEKFPEHPITRGVRPFEINDEWYFNMRFPEDMENVTPILTAVPPDKARSRPDGPHSNNPFVRANKGRPEHVAWCIQRPDGGRGFGFTGGHVHWNWAQPDFRKVVLNAIAWTAQVEIPKDGVPSKSPSREELEAVLPKKRQKPKPKGDVARIDKGKAAFASKVVQGDQVVDVKVDLKGAKGLWLVVTDGGNGFSCDWADWAEPRLVGKGGEKKLTELEWKSASSGFGSVRKNQNCGGGELRMGGVPVSYGLGTHANSIIHYALPEGYDQFIARAGLDNGGTDQGACGESASVQFLVYTKKPPRKVARAASGRGRSAPGSRDPKDAIAGLEIHDELEATLFASEPTILSPTNLDVDERGRVWVCEVVNYRGHNGKRKEGDRILILEDTDGDGKADDTKVYYQGSDINSALGIGVFGNQVIVSAAPWVFAFYDDDGDDLPDRKEVLFSKTGQPQHDHSNHSFIFGPDGKLYWNFGNTGKHVHDRDGKIVVDKYGHEVRDNGKPYYGGMVFRCNPDLSEFEVLGHNFRNNYEVTVDSYGTIWQSDNDDDGNRGVRINWVMEFGNYGYRDELTGRGWRDDRTNIEMEVPLRHWHLNDPGVVPNLLQTGAGSPTGITVYEGELLPDVFRGEVVHCDAGPNVVRAYPVEKDGAGYSAEIVPMMVGTKDRWFRPADVCVAPDGSLFVTDWYDPGVGGHGMGDLERGRIYRLTPKGGGSKYRVPKPRYDTAESAAEALESPSYAVRYLAWNALRKMGEAAVPALTKMYSSANSAYRARALWLLGKIEGKSPVENSWVVRAIGDEDSRIRITALRLARQLEGDLLPLVAKLVDDRDAQVRRECLIALRHQKGDRAAELWARLAQQHDGSDRWYLEAIGIAADGKWDEWLSRWMELVGKSGFGTKAARDIVWRSRAEASPALAATQLVTSMVPDEELPRSLRAFDYWTGPTKTSALRMLASDPERVSESRQGFVFYEAAKRLEGVDVQSQPKLAAALDKALRKMEGTEEFVEMVERFGIEKRFPNLVTLASREDSPQEVATAAAKALIQRNARQLIAEALRGEDTARAARFASSLGNTGDGRLLGLLLPTIEDATAPVDVRRAATRALMKNREGARRVLELAEKGELDKSLEFVAAVDLSRAQWKDVRKRAGEVFKLPPAKNSKPLPPIAQMVQRRGDAKKGAAIYKDKDAGTCANCHQVGTEGREVGPALTEIGSKLSREGMYESILFPNAAISHNYETWTAVAKNGQAVSGVLLSRGGGEVVLKDANAIAHRLKESDLVTVEKSPDSLMPADLQKNLTVEDLADLVEYLLTLKKR